MTSFRQLFDLTGKTAIVTGGAGILGRPFCRGLAEFGAQVIVIELDEEAAENFAQELTAEYGVKCRGLACDISSLEDVERMTARAVDEFGEINILHNNANAKSADLQALFAPFEDYSLDEWRRLMSVNLDGQFLMARVVGKQMVQQGKGGSIIQTASIYGIMAPDPRIYEGSEYMGVQINTPAVYTAAKAGVIGLTRHLATYWADKGIRVNSITPGGVESGQNETFKQKYAARIPLGRMGQADEMVGALVYLASDASSYMTGANLVVDGGLHAW